MIYNTFKIKRYEMTTITYKEIGSMINKAEPTIKSMAKANAPMLDLIKIGALCKKYDVTLADIEAIIEFKKRLAMEKL